MTQGRGQCEGVDVDGGQLVYHPWKMSRSSWTCTSSPQSAGGPQAGETHRWFGRFTQMRKDLPDQAWFGDECDQPDIATTHRALQRKTRARSRWKKASISNSQ